MTKKKIKTIGVLTSGGDAPGMNAAVRAVVRTAVYHGLSVYGISEGYEGMIKGKIKKLDRNGVANILHRGGTILKTARSETFKTKEGRKKAYAKLKAKKIDALVVIGGNGTFTGAKFFSSEFKIPVVGLPGTIDNDIYGTDFTIGFDTAINTAIDAVDKIRDTADSHNRLFFIEVMGRHSGYIALYTGIGSGASHVFLPETETDLSHLMNLLRKSAIRKKLFNLVIVAEGNSNGNASEIAKKVSEELNYDTRVAIIGHLQRGGSPTARDRVLASRLGFAAVNALVEGKSNVAIGETKGKISFTSFNHAISKQKKLDNDLITLSDILAQ